MAEARALEIYEHHVRWLSAAERLRLLALIAESLEEEAVLSDKAPARHSIMEFYGRGRASWDGTDAQEYVNRLRSEWNHRP